MKKRTFVTNILGIGSITIGILVFTHYSNDHTECENSVEYSIGENGEKIVTQTHNCKEKFNF